jgi:hypothetical protein
VLALTAGRLTATQRLRLDRRATAADVDTAPDFADPAHDAARLWLFAFARGRTPELDAALADRAARTAARLALGVRRVALVLDASASMAGGDTQPLRPLAVALALRDAIAAAGADITELWCGGRRDGAGLVHPAGPTALADGLLAAFQARPELVVLVTDGYENAPAAAAPRCSPPRGGWASPSRWCSSARCWRPRPAACGRWWRESRRCPCTAPRRSSSPGCGCCWTPILPWPHAHSRTWPPRHWRRHAVGRR